VMRTSIFRSLNLQSNDFRIEPEITSKVLRLGYRIYQVPISYMGRTYEEGKKIKSSDGFKAVFTLLKYRAWRGNPPVLKPIDQAAARAALTAIAEYVPGMRLLAE
jgi:hypothetical protein